MKKKRFVEDFTRNMVNCKNLTHRSRNFRTQTSFPWNSSAVRFRFSGGGEGCEIAAFDGCEIRYDVGLNLLKTTTNFISNDSVGNNKTHFKTLLYFTGIS